MGCSFCKSEVKVNINSIQHQKLGKIITLSKASSANQNNKLVSPAKNDWTNEAFNAESGNFSEDTNKNMSSTDQQNFDDSYFKRSHASQSASLHNQKNKDMYLVVNIESKSVYLKTFVFGVNSVDVCNLLPSLFIDKELIINLNNSSSLETNSTFKVTKKGMSMLEYLREKHYRPTKISDTSINKRRISRLIMNAVPSVEKSRSNLLKFRSNSKVFIDSTNYFISFCVIKREHLNMEDFCLRKETNSNIKENVLVLSFDCSDKSSFDYIIQFLESGTLNGFSILVIGVKNLLNAPSNNKRDGLSVNVEDQNKGRTYEVNEDFASITFMNLEVEFFTLNISQEARNRDVGCNDNSSSCSVDETVFNYHSLSVQEKLFISMFLFDSAEDQINI